jgi:hypothetical protein
MASSEAKAESTEKRRLVKLPLGFHDSFRMALRLILFFIFSGEVEFDWVFILRDLDRTVYLAPSHHQSKPPASVFASSKQYTSNRPR